MSIRHNIISTINKWHDLTFDDLLADLGFDRKKLQDNIKSTVADGLVERFIDEDKPAYRLTTKGRAWLINRPETPAQPEVAKNTGSKRAERPSDASPTPAAPAVEQPESATVATARTRGNVTEGYIYMFASDIKETPEDAMAAVLKDLGPAGYVDIARIARVKIVGRVESRPTLVMEAA